mgnify:FL=1
MSDQTSDEVCPKCGLEYIKKARIEEFYSPKHETIMFCEDDNYAYLHETKE